MRWRYMGRTIQIVWDCHVRVHHLKAPDISTSPASDPTSQRCPETADQQLMKKISFSKAWCFYHFFSLASQSSQIT